MQSWIYLGVSGKGHLQEAGDRGGRHSSRAEADTGKLRQVPHNNCGVLPNTEIGENPWEEFGADPEGGH